MTSGPDYFAAAADHLADAEALGIHRDSAEFNRHMRLFEANATMARLALDAARAANLGEISNAMEVHSEETQARANTLHATRNAWVAAVTEGGAS